jgi:hypothetical protein
MTEAVVQLRRGIDTLSRVPDNNSRPGEELKLQLTLGHALLAIKGYGAREAGEAYARAHQLCEQMNKPSQLGPVLYGQWVFCSERGDLEKAEHCATEMLQFGETLDDAGWVCFGSIFRGNSRCYLGKFIDSQLDCENALSLWNPIYHSFLSTPSNQHVHVLIVLSRTLFCLGYIDQARLRRAEALTEVRRESPHTLALSLTWACYDSWEFEGREAAQTMLRLADEILTISSEQGFSMWFGVGNAVRGWC